MSRNEKPISEPANIGDQNGMKLYDVQPNQANAMTSVMAPCSGVVRTTVSSERGGRGGSPERPEASESPVEAYQERTPASS